MGEQLSVQALSAEFQISERTLRRDFRERLSCLELTYRQGSWSLARPHNGTYTSREILHFARATSLEQLFPAIDNKLIAVLTDSRIPSPYIVWLSPLGRKPTPFGGFWRITQAILDRTLLDLTADTEQYRWFAPYRLVYFENSWYLVGEFRQQAHVLRLESITDACLTKRQFLRRRQIDALTADPHFIRSLPHFQYLRKVLTDTETQE